MLYNEKISITLLSIPKWGPGNLIGGRVIEYNFDRNV